MARNKVLKPTLLETADVIPPNLCRLLARRMDGSRKPITREEIAERSGLSLGMIDKLSTRKTWKGVDIDVVDAFRKGCGITVENQSYHMRYAKRTFRKQRVPMAHLEYRPLGRKLTKRIFDDQRSGK